MLVGTSIANRVRIIYKIVMIMIMMIAMIANYDDDESTRLGLQPLQLSEEAQNTESLIRCLSGRWSDILENGSNIQIQIIQMAETLCDLGSI